MAGVLVENLRLLEDKRRVSLVNLGGKESTKASIVETKVRGALLAQHK